MNTDPNGDGISKSTNLLNTMKGVMRFLESAKNAGKPQFQIKETAFGAPGVDVSAVDCIYKANSLMQSVSSRGETMLKYVYDVNYNLLTLVRRPSALPLFGPVDIPPCRLERLVAVSFTQYLLILAASFLHGTPPESSQISKQLDAFKQYCGHTVPISSGLFLRMIDSASRLEMYKYFVKSFLPRLEPLTRINADVQIVDGYTIESVQEIFDITKKLCSGQIQYTSAESVRITQEHKVISLIKSNINALEFIMNSDNDLFLNALIRQHAGETLDVRTFVMIRSHDDSHKRAAYQLNAIDDDYDITKNIRQMHEIERNGTVIEFTQSDPPLRVFTGPFDLVTQGQGEYQIRNITEKLVEEYLGDKREIHVIVATGVSGAGKTVNLFGTNDINQGKSIMRSFLEGKQRGGQSRYTVNFIADPTFKTTAGIEWKTNLDIDTVCELAQKYAFHKERAKATPYNPHSSRNHLCCEVQRTDEKEGHPIYRFFDMAGHEPKFQCNPNSRDLAMLVMRKYSQGIPRILVSLAVYAQVGPDEYSNIYTAQQEAANGSNSAQNEFAYIDDEDKRIVVINPRAGTQTLKDDIARHFTSVVNGIGSQQKYALNTILKKQHPNSVAIVDKISRLWANEKKGRTIAMSLGYHIISSRVGDLNDPMVFNTVLFIKYLSIAPIDLIVFRNSNEAIIPPLASPHAQYMKQITMEYYSWDDRHYSMSEKQIETCLAIAVKALTDTFIKDGRTITVLEVIKSALRYAGVDEPEDALATCEFALLIFNNRPQRTLLAATLRFMHGLLGVAYVARTNTSKNETHLDAMCRYASENLKGKLQDYTVHEFKLDEPIVALERIDDLIANCRIIARDRDNIMGGIAYLENKLGEMKKTPRVVYKGYCGGATPSSTVNENIVDEVLRDATRVDIICALHDDPGKEVGRPPYINMEEFKDFLDAMEMALITGDKTLSTDVPKMPYDFYSTPMYAGLIAHHSTLTNACETNNITSIKKFIESIESINGMSTIGIVRYVENMSRMGNTRSRTCTVGAEAVSPLYKWAEHQKITDESQGLKIRSQHITELTLRKQRRGQQQSRDIVGETIIYPGSGQNPQFEAKRADRAVDYLTQKRPT